MKRRVPLRQNGQKSSRRKVSGLGDVTAGQDAKIARHARLQIDHRHLGVGPVDPGAGVEDRMEVRLGRPASPSSLAAGRCRLGSLAGAFVEAGEIGVQGGGLLLERRDLGLDPIDLGAVAFDALPITYASPLT